LILAAIFNSVEAAIFSISTHQVNRLKSGIGRRVVLLLQKKDYVISVLQIVITLNNLLSVSIGALNYHDRLTNSIAQHFNVTASIANTLSILVVTIAFTLIELIFVEIFPKRIGFNYPVNIVSSLSFLIVLTDRIFEPVAKLLHLISSLLIKILMIDKEDTAARKREHLEFDFISSGNKITNRTTHRFINKLIQLSDANVDKVMVPRINVVFLNGEYTLQQAEKALQNLEFRYYPVCESNIRDTSIIGFVNIKNFKKILNESATQDNKLYIREIVQEIGLFPRNIDLFSLFVNMTENNLPLAVIVDEYLNILGCVFLTDLISMIGKLK
jgi:putative hemolysin